MLPSVVKSFLKSFEYEIFDFKGDFTFKKVAYRNLISVETPLGFFHRR